jgi:hypothetical protein
MGKEPADVSEAFEQYHENINKIKGNIDGIIDRLVENFNNIHANRFVQTQIDDGLTRMKGYLNIHIPLHEEYNKLIKCFPPLYDRSAKILKKLTELRDIIEELIQDLESAKQNDPTIYREKIIPKLRKIVEQYREISLANELKQCLETIIMKPLTFIDERIIHPFKTAVIAFMGTSPTEKVPETPPKEELVLAEIMQRIASTIPKPVEGGGRRFSRRHRNKQHRRKKTRRNIRKKLNGLY